MKQEGQAWLDWRDKGLGSSDAAAIMGASPYKTVYQVWLEKTGRGKIPVNKFATQRGTKLEPVARSYFELLLNKDFPAMLAEHEEMNWLRASLDGYNKEDQAILEIKAPGLVEHKAAAAGDVPEKYYWQVQHQMIVTGAKKANFASYHPEWEPKGVIVEVYPDQKDIDRYLKKAFKFWNVYVKEDKPPPLSKADTKIVKRKPELEKLFKRWGKVDRIHKKLDAEKKKLTKEIQAMKITEHPRVQAFGFETLRSFRKGAIDYSKIPELVNVDLEPYRKKEISVFSIKPIKSKDAEN